MAFLSLTSNDVVHPSVGHGIPKLVRNVQNFYVYLGLTVSETELKPRIINHNFGKKFDHYGNNNFFGFHPKQAFLPSTQFKFGSWFVEIQKNATFLDIFNFQYIYGKRKSH